jgi:hypothetical protein
VRAGGLGPASRNRPAASAPGSTPADTGETGDFDHVLDVVATGPWGGPFPASGARRPRWFGRSTRPDRLETPRRVRPRGPRNFRATAPKTAQPSTARSVWIAVSGDRARVSYLDEHRRACHQPVMEGIPLKGYFARRLLDNFEWAYGYSKRFGIVYADYRTRRRIPESRADWYAEVTRGNGLAAQ